MLCLVFKLSATHIVRVVKGSEGLKHKNKTRCKVNMSRPERVIRSLCSSTYRLSTHRTSIAGYTRLSRQLLGATSGLGVLAKQLFAGVGITGSDYGNAPRTIPQHLTAVAIDCVRRGANMKNSLVGDISACVFFKMYTRVRYDRYFVQIDSR